MHHGSLIVRAGAVLAVGALLPNPIAHADGDNNTLVPNNKRLNDAVVANVYTVQHQSGCTGDVRIDQQLQRAAQWHTNDLLNNRSLDGHIGSDGSNPQDRADAAGFDGRVAETVAVHPAMAITGIDLINRWYHDPADFATMSDCANTHIGVWSENNLDRTVVVAVYGQPRHRADEPSDGSTTASGAPLPLDPAPDYDASDEVEYVITALPWILRGVYPPPAYPPN
ncbi:MAG: CAP domain-containing protein [Mycolicibacterium fortuitum]|uniref:CAP domain-containing protein n=1 Tax=Mycolicibacterium fortuitum TaxID=1766 RepID=UPI0022BA6D8D|nr:CAP domain-containing protein [Mycolicibacterium fortuitum]WAY19739.1 CAP domain-containing protein [Mycolicibacterium fortuitum]